ncbi:MAG TPA: ATP-binding protein [Gemmatimonadales bacterium]|nr:ATP-binding protein [Gemmatimonadales bacterium]
MKVAGRLFVTTSVVAVVAVIGFGVAADRLLRSLFEDAIAGDLEEEALLVARLLPADSLRWPDLARELGARSGHRITLIDPKGVVRGDTEFDRDALALLENHLLRPEVQQALTAAKGVGRNARLSASTNERRMYLAVRGGPPGLAIVRVSTTLAAMDAQVAGFERALAVAGAATILAALFVAGLVAWRSGRTLTEPLMALDDAARAIADRRAPAFPDADVSEIAQHIGALRAMHEQLDQRFTDLVREREETTTLIETMADGVVAADAHNAVVMLNRAARRLLGYGPDDPFPALAELFHEKEARELVGAVLAGGEAEPREVERGGRTLRVIGRALPNGGALLVIHDGTELRRLETVRRDFVANVSHELKTPLTSIAGYAETLATEASAGSQTERFARTILNNARRMQRLVDDLLDLSRIESGRWSPSVARVDVGGIAGETWAAFADRAREQRIEFAAAASNGREVCADPEALREALTNLFDNALRHTRPGGRIGVSVEPTQGGATVAVSDTGTGIAAEHLPRIFERFYRADPARSRVDGGTGLGLAIVKHLVEAHGGHVGARSKLGEGTTIRMFFPNAEVAG